MSDLTSTDQQNSVIKKAIGFSYSNVNYKIDKEMLVISEKFYANLSSMNAIPPFQIKGFSSWKDSIHSFLRGTYMLEALIDEERELPPIQLESESTDDYEWRMSIFRKRDYALYLILDRSVTLGSVPALGLDPKFSALSTLIYKKSKTEGTYPGSILFSELQLAVGGSHLHSRINAVMEVASLRMERVGGEQATFNTWRHLSEQHSSLGIDIEMSLKCSLIHAVGHVREHQSTMVSLASLSPDELRALSAQDIISRFLSSAEHAKGLKGSSQKDLALYTSASDVPRAPVKRDKANGTVCFNCGKAGHISPRCPEPRVKRSAASENESSKRFKKA